MENERQRAEQARRDNLERIAVQWRGAADAVAELALWADGGGLDDYGTPASFTVTRAYPGEWSVSASSDDAGGGHATGDGDLAGLVVKVAEEIRDHPEREKERQRQEAVAAVARWAGSSYAEAVELLDEYAKATRDG